MPWFLTVQEEEEAQVDEQPIRSRKRQAEDVEGRPTKKAHLQASTHSVEPIKPESNISATTNNPPNTKDRPPHVPLAEIAPVQTFLQHPMSSLRCYRWVHHTSQSIGQPSDYNLWWNNLAQEQQATEVHCNNTKGNGRNGRRSGHRQPNQVKRKLLPNVQHWDVLD